MEEGGEGGREVRERDGGDGGRENQLSQYTMHFT